MPTKKSRNQNAETEPSVPVAAPAPMCIPLNLDGEEDVLLLSSVSVAQWNAELGPEEFESRFTDVMDTLAPPSIDRMDERDH